MTARGVSIAALIFAASMLARSLAAQTEPATRPAPAVAEARARALKEVSVHLICQCGCNMILAECSHQSCPFALPERKRILELLDDGMSDDEIIAVYVRDYGRTILSAPPTDGGPLDRLAWAMPYIALALGIVVATVVARRLTVSRGDGAQAAAAASEDPYLARVESELAGEGEGGAGADEVRR